MAYQDETFIPIRIVNRIAIAIIVNLKFIELFMDNRVQARTIDIIIILDVIFLIFQFRDPSSHS